MHRNDLSNTSRAPSKMDAFVALVFGLVFLGFGIVAIVLTWIVSWQLGIFGTLFGLAFLAVGGSTAYTAAQALAGKHPDSLLADPTQASDPPDDRGSHVGYVCPACGAPLASGADVSPHGDAKCSHCGGWFNVHKSNA